MAISISAIAYAIKLTAQAEFSISQGPLAIAVISWIFSFFLGDFNRKYLCSGLYAYGESIKTRLNISDKYKFPDNRGGCVATEQKNTVRNIFW